MPSKRKKRKSFSEQIRDAIRDSGYTRYKISKETGIEQSALSRFMSGQSGLSTSTLDLLAELLDLEIVMHGRRET